MVAKSLNKNSLMVCPLHGDKRPAFICRHLQFRLLIALLVMVPCSSFASEPTNKWPAEVTTFIERRDLCDHFRGEEPYDEERRKFLEKNIVEYCTGTDSQLARLREKYQKNPGVINLLAGYEEDIEPANGL